MPEHGLKENHLGKLRGKILPDRVGIVSQVARAVRWQLWLRLFGLADVIAGLLLLIGGNLFGKFRWDMTVRIWQHEYDHNAGPLAWQVRQSKIRGDGSSE